MAIARNFRVGLFDRLNGTSDLPGFELSEDDKNKAARQGLLGLAAGLLGTGGGFGNALGAGIQSGLLAMNQGADDVVNNRYRQAMMQRTMAGMDRNTKIEELSRRAIQGGQLDPQAYSELASYDPERAKALREAVNGPQTNWQMGRIGDGQGGEIDVLFDPRDPTKIRTIDGQPIGGAPQQPAPQGGLLGVSPGMGSAPDIGILRDAVEQQESGGNPNAVSPAGAIGRMQTMPGTLLDPGFGVAPARDRSDAEMTRVGDEYLNAMVQKYGTEGGLAAYNWGPGNWEAALRSTGGNTQAALAKAPQETQKYVPSVLQRAGGRMSAVPAGLGIGRRPAKGNESDESFSQPQEVVDPSTGKPILVQFGNRGTIRPVSGYGAPQNAASANKEAMQLEKQVTSLSKRLTDENVPLIDTQLSTIEGSLRPYLDAGGKVAKDIPGYGELDSLKPDIIAGDEARDLRQQVATLSNVILKSRSGAAVTDSELRRFLQEAGTNKGMPEQQLVNGLKLVRQWFDAQKRNVRGGYSPEVVDTYYRNSPENSGLLGAVATPPAPAKRLKFNPNTGKLE